MKVLHSTTFCAARVRTEGMFKTSRGLGFFPRDRKASGCPFSPKILNESSASFRQSKSSLLWMCSISSWKTSGVSLGSSFDSASYIKGRYHQALFEVEVNVDVKDLLVRYLGIRRVIVLVFRFRVEQSEPFLWSWAHRGIELGDDRFREVVCLREGYC